MDRELPEISLDGTRFIIDVAFAELRQKDDPLNCISFYDMESDGYEYFFDYDCLSKRLATDHTEEADRITLRLDHMAELDPEGMRLKYNIRDSYLPECDEDFTADPELFEQRLAGKLPIIEICGSPYIVDLDLRQLRMEGKADHIIYLDALEKPSVGDKYICYYDTLQKISVHIPETETRLPEHVKMVLVPNDYHMDAVGYARAVGMPEDFYFECHPVQPMLQARDYPVSLSPLGRRIAENLKKEQTNQQPEQATHQDKPTQRKRGRHL